MSGQGGHTPKREAPASDSLTRIADQRTYPAQQSGVGSDDSETSENESLQNSMPNARSGGGSPIVNPMRNPNTRQNPNAGLDPNAGWNPNQNPNVGDVALGAYPRSQWGNDLTAPESKIDTAIMIPPDIALVKSFLTQREPINPRLTVDTSQLPGGSFQGPQGAEEKTDPQYSPSKTLK